MLHFTQISIFLLPKFQKNRFSSTPSNQSRTMTCSICSSAWMLVEEKNDFANHFEFRFGTSKCDFSVIEKLNPKKTKFDSKFQSFFGHHNLDFVLINWLGDEIFAELEDAPGAQGPMAITDGMDVGDKADNAFEQVLKRLKTRRKYAFVFQFSLYAWIYYQPFFQ